MVKKGSFFKRIFGMSTTEEPQKKSGDGKTAARTGTATATMDKPKTTTKPAGMKTAEPSKTTQTVKTTGPATATDPAKKPEPAKDSSVKPEILDADEKVVDKKEQKLEVISEKLTQQEEASIKINKGLKGLSSLLTDIDDRLKEQSKTSTELVTTVRTIPEMLKDLPESSRAGIELLNAITQILEHQNKGVEDLNGRVATFSESVGDISSHLEQEARKRSQDVETFQRNIGDVKQTVAGISEQQTKVNQEHSTHIKEIASALKKSHEVQQERVDAIISRMKTMNGLVIFLIMVIIAGLVAVVLSLT